MINLSLMIDLPFKCIHPVVYCACQSVSICVGVSVALAAVDLIQLRTNKCFKFSTKPPKNCIEKTCRDRGRKRKGERAQSIHNNKSKNK